MTWEEFNTGWQIFSATFRISASKTTLRVWYRMLEDLNRDDYARAMMRITREEEDFFRGRNFVRLVRRYASIEREKRESRTRLTRRTSRPELPPGPVKELVRRAIQEGRKKE